MTRIKKTYRLSSTTISQINEVAIEQSCSREKAIEHVFKEYKERKKKEEELQIFLQEQVMEEIKKVRRDLGRILGASNNIDRNTQVQLEFWNHYFVIQQPKELISTNKMKRKELSEADALVKQRIGELRHKKLEYEKRKMGNGENAFD